MRGSNQIAHRPFVPYHHPERKQDPYIVRMAPGDGSVALETIGGTGRITLHLVKPDGTETAYPMTSREFSLNGLTNDSVYAAYLTDEAGHRSYTRRFIPCPVPEGTTVINYLHPEDDQYAFSGHCLCSPSLARLDDGRLVAGMDVFGQGEGQLLELLFRSDDNGKTWHYLCDIFPFYWATLFVHRGDLYLLGLSTEYGNLQIARSSDGGETWSAPSVIFFSGNVNSVLPMIHRAPMQVVEDGGRLHTTCEFCSCELGGFHHSFYMPAVISIDAGADLLDPEAWQCTGFLPFDGAWKEAENGGRQGHSFEGNLLRAPDGRFIEALRYGMGRALILEYDPARPEELLKFDHIAKWPVVTSMFRVAPYKGEYYMVTNRATEATLSADKGFYRNILSLYRSKDLENWEFVRDIINRETENSQDTGFQYPCVLWEEDGLYLTIRSGFNHPLSAHDSNYSLFTHIEI